MSKGIEGICSTSSIFTALKLCLRNFGYGLTCPWCFLQDQRLVFQLKKQEIVEHLRKGTSEAQQQALGNAACLPLPVVWSSAAMLRSLCVLYSLAVAPDIVGAGRHASRVPSDIRLASIGLLTLHMAGMQTASDMTMHP